MLAEGFQRGCLGTFSIFDVLSLLTAWMFTRPGQRIEYLFRLYTPFMRCQEKRLLLLDVIIQSIYTELIVMPIGLEEK